MQSIFSKAFEQIIKIRLQSFIERNGLLSNSQYGFRENSSPTMALLDLVHTIERNQNEKRHTIVILLDFRKAFDTVDHKLLLAKLEKYGCRGIALNLFSSYLSNRKQFTQIKGQVSALKDVIYGVPQGSILGPLLFLIYINDIYMACKSGMGHLKLFADDTAILASHENQDILILLANAILKEIYQWLVMNKLSLNVGKTFYMLIQANKKGIKEWAPHVVIENISINSSQHVKYLGVIIDDKLSFNHHIQYLVKNSENGLESSRKLALF